MSKAIRCDRCNKLDDSMDVSCLSRADINFGSAFREQWYPDKVDLCGDCTKELLEFIDGWARPKEKEKSDSRTLIEKINDGAKKE